MSLLGDRMRKIKFYVKLYIAFVKNTFVRESDYRGNLVAEIIDSLLNFAVNIIFFNILYLNVDYIAGWDSLEMLALIGVGQLLTSIMYMLFMNNLPRIQRYVFHGDLDYILLKPCDDQFYVSFRYFYFGAIPNLIFSIGLMVYTIIKLQISIGILRVLLFCLYIVCGVAICYSIWMFVMTLSIVVLKVGQIHELFLSSLKFLEYPKGIYKNVIKIVLLYIIPFVTISNVPVELLLGKINTLNSIYISTIYSFCSSFQNFLEGFIKKVWKCKFVKEV